MPNYKSLFHLSLAGKYAKYHSGCTKVSVGSCIVKDGNVVAIGANRTMPNLCKSIGCLRIEKYGDNAKTHRNPDDCRAIHSEVDAISSAAKQGIDLDGSTIYVTRYPCEACARMIISAGIKEVVYGRNQKISDMTREMFESAGVTYYNETDYMEDDTVV